MSKVSRSRLLALSSSASSAIVILSVIALALRLGFFLTTYDVPGDGPTRAIESYRWSLHPWLPTSGVWPPGLILLHGPANWLLPRPDIVGRLVNIILGTLTIPILYLLAYRSFGSIPALGGAFAVAVWPLHIELSASSLSEAPFVFEILAGLLFVDVALAARPRRCVLTVGIALIGWASMTRYEGWWFLPALPLYVLWRGRDLRLAAATGMTLAAFPGPPPHG